MGNKCIVCGKNNKPKEAATYEFQHGTISVCYKCRPALMFTINGQNVPIWWIAKDDLHSPDLTERISTEEADELQMKDIVCIAQHVEELLNEQYEAIYDQVIKDAIPYWKKDKEEELIRETPKEKLPTLIGNLEFSENEDLLTSRLKGDNDE